MFDKIKIVFRTLIGFIIKSKFRLIGIPTLDGLNKTPRDKLIIVSLTSYGRRVKKTLPYVLLSLMKQTVKPDKIIVWLDNVNWNEDKLSYILKRLSKQGIEILFCEDIKSYKKLIPVLSMYPDDIIITVDDDVYYSCDTIERLYKKHLEFPNAVCCNIGHLPTFDIDGLFLSYTEWNHNIVKDSSNKVFPVGVGGILYSPGALDSDVFRKDIFQKLTPNADDVWFWSMAIKNNTLRCLTENKLFFYWDMDFFFQYFHQYSALNHVNVNEHQNDLQIKAVFDYYNLWGKD